MHLCRKQDTHQAIGFLKSNFLNQSLDMFEHAKKLLVKVGDGNLGLERLSESQAAFATVQAEVEKMQNILETLQAIQTKHQDTDVVSRATVGALLSGPPLLLSNCACDFDFWWTRLLISL